MKPRTCLMQLAVQNVETGTISFVICGGHVCRGMTFPVCVNCLMLCNGFVLANRFENYQKVTAACAAAAARECVN